MIGRQRIRVAENHFIGHRVDKGSHLLGIPKLIESSKFRHFDFGMGFGTAVDAEDLFLGGDERPVPEAAQPVEKPLRAVF